MELRDIEVGMKVRLLSKTDGEVYNSIEDFYLDQFDDCCIRFFKKQGYGIVSEIGENSKTIMVSCDDDDCGGWQFSSKDLEPYKEDEEVQEEAVYDDQEQKEEEDLDEETKEEEPLEGFVDYTGKRYISIKGKTARVREGNWAFKIGDIIIILEDCDTPFCCHKKDFTDTTSKCDEHELSIAIYKIEILEEDKALQEEETKQKEETKSLPKLLSEATIEELQSRIEELRKEEISNKLVEINKLLAEISIENRSNIIFEDFTLKRR